MSMMGNFLLVHDAEIDTLLAAPSGIDDVLDRAYAGKDPGYVDADRAWHAIHFLLTGTAWGGEPPLNFCASGGTPIGEEDVGYGPARALRAADVAALHAQLKRIDTATLVSRFDGARMDALEIYPQGWTGFDPKGPDAESITDAYEQIVALVAKGASAGRGMLVWLS